MTQHGKTNGPLFLENNQSPSNIWEAECRGRWCSRKPSYFIADFVAMNTKDKGPWGEKKEGVSGWDSKDQKHCKSRVSGKNILCSSSLSYVPLNGNKILLPIDISGTRPTQKRYPLETRHIIISNFSFPLRAKLEFFIICSPNLTRYIHLLFYIFERCKKSRKQNNYSLVVRSC